jgi:amino acid adenylation domain-containing protein
MSALLNDLLTKLRQNDIQLWLEGDRLRYRAAKDTLSSDMLAQVKEHKAAIVQFLSQVNQGSKQQLPAIVKIDRNGSLPLSFGQQRLWYLHQFEPESSSNNMPVVVRFTGSLNIAVLEQSLKAVVCRHEVLRTAFPSVDGQPTQVIAPDFDLQLPMVDLRQIPSEQRDAEALRIATKEARNPFDLANGPILRFLLLQLSNEEHLLLWNMHCIICDGASSDVFYRDLTTLYTAFIADKPSPFQELPVQYVDFAQWQREWIQGEVLESQLSYWKQKLEGTISTIQLPADHPRPPVILTYRGDRGARMLSKSLNERLTSLSQRLGGTLFMTLIAAFETLLHRYSQQNDILISFASGGRGQVETEGLIGFFSNTLIQRINFDGDPTFRDLFHRVREASLEAYAHQDLPFEKLVEELPPELSNSRSPLFQIKFALNPPWSNGRGMASVDLPDLNITSLFGYIYHGKTKYDLILVMREQDEGLGMVFDYNADLFESNTIERMLGHLENLLEGIVSDPDCKISDLPLLTRSDQQQLLYEWNSNTNPVPIQNICIHQLFEAQVKRSPNAIAVDCKDQPLTYQTLNNRANQLAHYLQAEGVGPETLVALCVEKSTEMLVGMLGILKAGGTYIPLDPSFPHERRLSKLQNAQVTLIVTQAHLQNDFAEVSANLVCLNTDWSKISQHSTEDLYSSVSAENLAYVIYTSGSTGEPKGVTITHRGMVNHSLAMSKIFELTSEDRVLQFCNISFDITVEEIFPTLMSGGTVVLPSPEIYTSTTAFLKYIDRETVTIINLPTAFWHELVNGVSLLNQPLPDHLRLVVVGGEKVSKSTYLKWRSLIGDSPRWLNTYGPTEATVTTTVYDPSGSKDLHPDAEIPIGRAISNLQTYVLDRNLKLSPIGVAGELYIGGVGLSRGYLNRPDISAKRFISNPFSSDLQSHLYKTGDTVRYLPDGNLEFIGRLDFQIKIRGFRVEPIEIETQLEQYSEVKQALVLCQVTPTGDKFLVAYLAVKNEPAFELTKLQSFLQQKLPPFMIPSSFVVLDSLPLNLNGKVDRHALIDLELAKQIVKEFTAPRDEVEQKLENIWEKLLGHQDIDIHDNFFELGGNSLLSVRLVTEIEKAFNYHLPLSSFFQINSIAEIAQWIREKPLETISVEDRPQELAIEDYRALLAHSAGRIGKHVGKRGLIIETLPTEAKSSQPFVWIGDINVSKKLNLQQPIYTMPVNSWSPLKSPRHYISAVAAVLVDELLTVQPSGPYMIGAYCYEGLVALEMAQQLQKQGKEVALLALIDKFGPSKPFRFYLRLDWYALVLKIDLHKLSQLSLPDKLKYVNKRIQKRLIYETNKPQIADEFIIKTQALNSLDEAEENYIPKVYSGNVVLIRSTKTDFVVDSQDLFQPDFSYLFPYSGWEGLLTGKVESYKMKCRHLEVYEHPYIEELGCLLSKSLKKFFPM